MWKCEAPAGLVGRLRWHDRRRRRGRRFADQKGERRRHQPKPGRDREDHPLDVHGGGPALADQPARRVAEQVDLRMAERAHEAIGHRLARHIEVGVHGHEHEVELGERGVIEVERAVFEDVDLGAPQHDRSLAAVVDPRDGAALREEALAIEAARDAKHLGVIGDRDVVVAQTRPRAASTISASVLRPSVAVVCI
jgi:hypothetical protein